jgi:hypothetical protein
MSDESIEKEIIYKGLTAPRVTPSKIEAIIDGEYYFTASSAMENNPSIPGFHKELDLLTFCVLVLENGFTVTGESACASAENFDSELGRKIARENAIQKIWPLEGYLLKSKLADKKYPVQPPQDNAHVGDGCEKFIE